jgi:hypothetical protein
MLFCGSFDYGRRQAGPKEGGCLGCVFPSFTSGQSDMAVSWSFDPRLLVSDLFVGFLFVSMQEC